VTTLEDDRQIRNVLYRYCRGVDRMDFELVRSCYWPGARDDHGAFKGTVDEFIDWIARLLPRNDVTTHQLTNILIEGEVDGRAFVETYGMADHQTVGGPDAHNSTICFRYLDRFERREGEWRIADRFCTTEWVRVHAQSTIFTPDERFERGRRDGSDRVYRRP
jgi:hypothetical protein